MDQEGSRKRLDSTLEAAGAEFLVLGLLLVEGIQASKAYVNSLATTSLRQTRTRERQCACR